VQGRLGQQRQGVGLLLLERRRFRTSRLAAELGGLTEVVVGAGRGLLGARPLIQRLTGGVEGLHQQRPDLRRQPSPDPDHTVAILIHLQGAAGVLPGSVAGLGLAIHMAPAPHDPLDMLGGAGAADRQQPLLGVRRRHPGERADLGVGQLAPREGVRQPRQMGEGAGDADLLSCRAKVEAHTPAQPVGTRAKAVVPAALGVELPDESEQPGRGRLEVR